MNLGGPSELSYHIFFKDAVNRGNAELDATLKRRADEALDKFDANMTNQREALLAGFNSTLTEQREQAMKDLSQLEKAFVDDFAAKAEQFKDSFIDDLNNSAKRALKDAQDILVDLGGEATKLEFLFISGQIYAFTFAGFLALAISTLLLKRQSVHTRLILFVAGLAILTASYFTAVYIYKKDLCTNYDRLAGLLPVSKTLS